MNLSELPWKPHPNHYGEQARVEFKNGYGASVLRGGEPFTYTKGGTYELAVLRHGKLCYDTPITEDVLGNLTEIDVEGILNQIEQL